MQANADTKTRLMEAGRKIFAEHGLEKARIRDICAVAGTNVAAVNYHFGSKDRFYITVLAENIRLAKERHPLDAGITAESLPKDRLKAFVRGMLEHFLTEEDDVSAKLSKLVLQELLSPSMHFGELVEKHIRPVNQKLRDIVQGMLPNAPGDIVSRCTGSIMAQFALFRFDKQVRESMGPEYAIENDEFDDVAQAILDFSLGGIERLRTLHG